MHDCNGTELKVGDIVAIEFEVVELQPTGDPDYCNVNLRAVHQQTVNGATPMNGSECTCTKFTHLVRRPAPVGPAPEPQAG